MPTMSRTKSEKEHTYTQVGNAKPLAVTPLTISHQTPFTRAVHISRKRSISELCLAREENDDTINYPGHN